MINIKYGGSKKEAARLWPCGKDLPASGPKPPVYTILTYLQFSPPLAQLFTKMRPELLQPPRGGPALRALLCHVNLWDPSVHALLALKHVLAALRMQPPPQSLFPTPAGGGGGGGDEDGGGGTPRGSQGERGRLGELEGRRRKQGRAW